MANTLAGQLQTIWSAAKGTGSFKLAAGASKTRVILYRPIFDRNGYIESFKEVGTPETK